MRPGIQRAVHCGKSRFTIKIPSLDTSTVTSCNCSICQINGYLNVYPLRKNVSFQSPYEELGSYAFASQTRVHKFCRTCGTSLLIDFERAEEEGLREHLLSTYRRAIPTTLLVRTLTRSMQVRTLKDVNVSKLKVENFDGKHLL